MKDGLDRTGNEKYKKNGKNFMHWNVALDALPGSARLVHVRAAGITTVKKHSSMFIFTQQEEPRNMQHQNDKVAIEMTNKDETLTA